MEERAVERRPAEGRAEAEAEAEAEAAEARAEEAPEGMAEAEEEAEADASTSEAADGQGERTSSTGCDVSTRGPSSGERSVENRTPPPSRSASEVRMAQSGYAE